jgi:WD40 repeat protein
VGLANGEVHAVDLETNLNDKTKRTTSAGRWNANGELTKARATAVVWRDGASERNVFERAMNDELTSSTAREDEFSFDWIALHADGSLFTYDSRRDGAPHAAFPPLADASALSVVQSTDAKSNPMARWHFGRSPLTAAAFSPDCERLAIVNGDGMCRIVDVADCRPNVVAGFKSYYAGFNAVTWSLCGRYVIAGGESDLIEVWGWYEREVIAWGCGGHRSWICDIGVDDVHSAKGDGRTLRFVSVGEDCRIALWDVVIPGDDDITHAERDDPERRDFSAPAESTARHSRTTSFAGPDAMVSQAARRDEVPRVVPLMTHKLHDNPVSAVVFTKEGILTAALADVKLWLRPENSSRYVKNDHEYSD